MKNLLLSSFCILFGFNPCFSQIEFGIKGGFTKSWPGYGEIELPEDAETSVNGYNISFLFGVPFNSRFGLIISPGFAKKGAACFPGWQPDFIGDSNVYLNYIELPVMLSRKFELQNGKFKIAPSIGYGFSVLNSASSHQDLSFPDGTNVVVRNIEIGDDSTRSLERFDHGFYASIRFNRLILQNHFVFIESTYYHGMKDYDKLNTSKNRNVNLNFGFGYTI